MAKLIDFDKKYMTFVAKSVKDLAELKDEELENALNDTVKKWLSTADEDLGGKTPDEYFADLSADELVVNLIAYGDGGMNVPEPLYRRIAETTACAERLISVVRNRNYPEITRGTALRLLVDMNAEGLNALLMDMLLAGGAFSDEAADLLKNAGYEIVEPLLARYDEAGEEAREAILDVLCAYPGIPKTSALLSEHLLSKHEKRALHATYAARLGDESLLAPLLMLYRMSDLSYFDYLEIRNAIEALGGDPGEERQFYGDADFERMREAAE